MRWDFFVRHYADRAQQARDPKFVAEQDGVWYPRAGTLGGCTAHNAMIFICPSNLGLGSALPISPAIRPGVGRRCGGTSSAWRTAVIGRCERFWRHVRARHSRHGWSGWLPTERPRPKDAIADDQVRAVIAKSVERYADEFGAPSIERLESAERSQRLARGRNRRGRRPLHAADHRRTISASGRASDLLAVSQQYPDRLRIELNALATRVVFDDGNRAMGVEYQKGDRLYAAHPGAQSSARRAADGSGAAGSDSRGRRVQHPAAPDAVRASAIPTCLRRAASRRGCRCAVSGRNLQDRYEVPVVNADAAAVGDARRRDIHDHGSAVSRLGGPAATASTRRTARCSASCSGRRSAGRCRICSATPCWPTSAAIAPATRRSFASGTTA